MDKETEKSLRLTIISMLDAYQSEMQTADRCRNEIERLHNYDVPEEELQRLPLLFEKKQMAEQRMQSLRAEIESIEQQING